MHPLVQQMMQLMQPGGYNAIRPVGPEPMQPGIGAPRKVFGPPTLARPRPELPLVNRQYGGSPFMRGAM